MKSLQSIPWFILLLAALLLAPDRLQAQGTAFTYQGRLTGPSGNPVNGPVDLQFKLFRTPSNGSPLATFENSSVAVSNGVLTLEVDFGSQFDGSPRWLEIQDVTHDVTFARQHLTPTPYAILAGGVATNSVTGANIQNATITAANIASGQVVKSINGLADAVTLLPGANVTLTPGAGAITIAGVPDPNTALLNANQIFTGMNTFNNAGNTFAGSFSGSGAGLVGVAASNLSGTLPLSKLPAAVVTNNASGVTLNGTFSGNGSGLTGLNGTDFIIENRTSDPPSPATGQIWLRTDL